MGQQSATVLPTIKTPGMPGFLLWMRRDNPRAYKQMADDIHAVATFEEQLLNYVDPAATMGGLGFTFDKPDIIAAEDNWYLDPASVLGSFDAAETVSGLGDISDVFSSIGGALSNAAGSVGSWLGQNAGSLITAGTSLAIVAKQSQLAQTQLQLAQLGQAPQQTAVAYTSSGQPYYVPVQRTGMSMTGAMYPQNSMLRSAPLGVPMWVWAAGLGGVALLFVLKKR